ncbi:MAG: GNAT family N-acetyltransferase [Candidatus Curtissbacteria bacterium]
MEKFVVREYKPSDKKAVLNLMKEFANFFVPINKFSKRSISPRTAQYFTEKLIRAVRKKNGKIFVVDFDDQLVGFIGFYFKKQPFEETFESIPMKIGYISELFVSTKYRRKNIGKLLLKKAEDFFKNNDCTHARLEVFGSNIKAREFYIKNGYTDWNIEVIKAL